MWAMVVESVELDASQMARTFFVIVNRPEARRRRCLQCNLKSVRAISHQFASS